MFWSRPNPKKNLRICIVGSRFPILGRSIEEGFLWPVAKGLVDRGHQITILSWQNAHHRPTIKAEKIEAYFLGEAPNVRRKDFPEIALRKFTELHNREPFDLVHSLDEAGFLIARHRKEFGVASTFDVAATQMSHLFAIMAMSQETFGSLLRAGFAVAYKFLTSYYSKDHSLLKVADGMFVTTPLQGIALERYYMYPEFKTFRVAYGSEYVDLSPRERSDQLRQKLGIPLNSKNIVTVTDMTEIGEVLSLLRAFHTLVVKKPASRLIIVGNGPLFKDIEFETLNLVLGSKVIFTGAVSNEDLPDYINLGDVYVNLSSRTSGFEPSMLEAMALEKVVVGSEISPISTIIEDGVDGFLIRPADESTLVKRLTEMFTETVPSREMGAKAREKVLDLFNLDKMVDQLLAGFKKTLQHTNRRPRPADILLRQPASEAAFSQQSPF